nr:hypothetical protein [Propionibacterium sp.]
MHDKNRLRVGRPLSRRALLGLAAVAAVAGGCSANPTSVAPAAEASVGASSDATGTAGGATGYLDAGVLHTLRLTFDTDAFAAMVQQYLESGDKGWLEADLALDGTPLARVGVRLKGNSSLRNVSATSAPETLPWLVRLDKFVAGQHLDGLRELIVRSNTTTTALNEAVALDLLAASGLAAQRAALARFSVNGSAEVLRLTVENPAQEWVDRVFATDGLLYKAEADGDWSYRGDDPASYADIFDQETGEDDLTPLIGFLDFVNNSSDAEFTAGLPGRLDTDAFARYLAFEELVDNFDDIDGPGNNAYLWWARATARMTVVAWDHNLAFGARPGGGGQGGVPGQVGGVPGQGGVPDQAAGGGRPTRPEGAPDPAALPAGLQPGEGMPSPADGQVPGRGQGGGPGGTRANALVTRFRTLAGGDAAVTAAKAALTASLIESGAGKQSLDRWATLIGSAASDLVAADALASERSAIESYVA